MKKTELQKIAAGLLDKNPEQNAVFMTEDGQAFFNKDARNNHAKERGLEVHDFFRSGVPTPEETADAIKALEVVSEELDASKAALEQIEKILTEESEVEVTTDTHPVVAVVAGAAAQLAEAKAHDVEMAQALDDQATEIVGLKETNQHHSDNLEKVVDNTVKLESDLKEAKADSKVLAEDLKATHIELSETKKELAAAKKAK